MYSITYFVVCHYHTELVEIPLLTDEPFQWMSFQSSHFFWFPCNGIDIKGVSYLKLTGLGNMFKYVCVDADLLGEEHGVFAASIRSYCIQTLQELLVQMVQCLWLSVLAY